MSATATTTAPVADVIDPTKEHNRLIAKMLAKRFLVQVGTAVAVGVIIHVIDTKLSNSEN